MKELFPLKQVMGFISSLVLTAVALLVIFVDMSITTGITILLITAILQAGLQLVLFMHAGETGDKKGIYTTVYYAICIAVATIFGTMLTMVWDAM